MIKKGLEDVVKFVKENSHTNIVIMEAPKSAAMNFDH
jgi:hypothetical protein